MGEKTGDRVVRILAISALPILVGLFVGATQFGGSMVPWATNMVDLGVYQRAGTALVTGGDIYNLPNSLPFIYPPFAALLALPMVWVHPVVLEIGWIILNVLALLAILYRLGLSGWKLSIAAGAAILIAEPVSYSLAFGQLGILLVAFVILDCVPGRRVLRGKRLLPEGVGVGLATAIKLTPGLTGVFFLAAGKIRAMWVSALTMLGVTALAAVILPGQSQQFWGRLLRGDSGLGNGVIYYTNQSVMGDIMRISGMKAGTLGLLACALVAALGVAAGAVWYRRGETGLAVTLVGIAGLLASPISWSHHFVWVVPLAVLLVLRNLPVPLTILGWCWAGWVVAAPFLRLPGGRDRELDYTWQQHLLSSTNAILGIVLLVAALSWPLFEPARLRKPAQSGSLAVGSQ